MPSAMGEKIQKLRKKKGFTLEKLAELTNSSKSYIWELENKNPPRPSFRYSRLRPPQPSQTQSL